MRYSLCGHEEGLDDAVHVAGVPKVDQAGLARLRLPSLPQKTRGERVGLGGPGTLVQHQLDLVLTGFREILRRQFEMVSCINRHNKHERQNELCFIYTMVVINNIDISTPHECMFLFCVYVNIFFM